DDALGRIDLLERVNAIRQLPDARKVRPLQPALGVIAGAHERRAFARLIASVPELLDALALVGFGDEQIAARVRGDVVLAVELAGPVSAAAERVDDLQRFMAQDVRLLIR